MESVAVQGLIDIDAKVGAYVDHFGFSIRNRKDRPNEDSYSVLSGPNVVVAVADGVTRSVENGEPYPDPSGAAEAARVFCNATADYLSQGFSEISQRTIRAGFGVANSKVRELNKDRDVYSKLDYWTNDWLCCCGALGIISNGILEYRNLGIPIQDKAGASDSERVPILYFGYIGDCGLLVISADCQIKYQSANAVALLEEKREEAYFDSEKERMIWWREYLRNKPGGYGVITGEPEAMDFCQIGELKLEHGDMVLFYTDGVKHCLTLPKRLKALTGEFSKVKQRICEMVFTDPNKDDKTFVLLRV